MGLVFHSVGTVVDKPYSCAACGHQCVAQVRARGTAASLAGAQRDMDEDASLALAFASCPSCGRQNEPEVRRATLRAVRNVLLVVVGCLLLAVGVRASSASRESLAFFLVAGLVAGLVFGGLLASVTLVRWSLANGRVTFPAVAGQAPPRPATARLGFLLTAGSLVVVVGAVVLLGTWPGHRDGSAPSTESSAPRPPEKAPGAARASAPRVIRGVTREMTTTPKLRVNLDHNGIVGDSGRVLELLAPHAAELDACLQREAESFTFDTAPSLNVKISPAGKVTRFRLSREGLPGLDQCLLRHVASIDFEPAGARMGLIQLQSTLPAALEPDPSVDVLTWTLEAEEFEFKQRVERQPQPDGTWRAKVAVELVARGSERGVGSLRPKFEILEKGEVVNGAATTADSRTVRECLGVGRSASLEATSEGVAAQQRLEMALFVTGGSCQAAEETWCVGRTYLDFTAPRQSRPVLHVAPCWHEPGTAPSAR